MAERGPMRMAIAPVRVGGAEMRASAVSTISQARSSREGSRLHFTTIPKPPTSTFKVDGLNLPLFAVSNPAVREKGFSSLQGLLNSKPFLPPIPAGQESQQRFPLQNRETNVVAAVKGSKDTVRARIQNSVLFPVPENLSVGPAKQVLPNVRTPLSRIVQEPRANFLNSEVTPKMPVHSNSELKRQKQEDVIIKDPSLIRITEVREEIKRLGLKRVSGLATATTSLNISNVRMELKTPWVPNQTPRTLESPIAQSNETIVETAVQKPNRVGAAALIALSEERERKKEAKLVRLEIQKVKEGVGSVLSKAQRKEVVTMPMQETETQTQQMVASLVDQSLLQQTFSVTASAEKTSVKSKIQQKFQILSEKFTSKKDRFKALVVTQFTKEPNNGKGEGKFIIDKKAQQARESVGLGAVDAAANKDTGYVEGTDIVVFMGQEPAAPMISGLLKMFRVSEGNKFVDGSYALTVKMIASIGRVAKRAAKKMVRDAIATFRAVSYSEREESNTATDKEVRRVMQGDKTDYSLAA